MRQNEERIPVKTMLKVHGECAVGGEMRTTMRLEVELP